MSTMRRRTGIAGSCAVALATAMAMAIAIASGGCGLGIAGQLADDDGGVSDPGEGSTPNAGDGASPSSSGDDESCM